MAARRRSNREGSIWQRQDGRWTGAAYVLTADCTFRRTYMYGRTREQVHARLVEVESSRVVY
jgi:integrase